MKIYTYVHQADDVEVTASGQSFAEVAQAAVDLKGRGVVGVSRGSTTKFFVRREDGKTVWPISAEATSVEIHNHGRRR